MWQWKSIDRALAIMDRLGFNTLILHQNDLPNFIVWPSAYFTTDFMFSHDPVRKSCAWNGANHLRAVTRRTARRNIRLFLEDNEICFPDRLVELHPELMPTKGVVCPTHPFWWEFERAKYAEVIKEIPEIAGVVVSSGTRESRVSIGAHDCTCDRCRSCAPLDWYANLIRSIHEPLKAAGKLLVVRDLADRGNEQSVIVEACARVSPDIVVSLKNTPHDFCPVYPDNPRIGRTNGSPQWAEFDTMGQFSGMGILPCSLVEDMQRRLRYCRRKGVTGVWFRADVGFVSDSSVFNTLNLLNLFGAGLLSSTVERDLDEVYDAWLSHGLPDPLKTESEQSDPVPVRPADRDRFREFMKASWSVMEKTVYVRGLAFTDGTGRFPDSIDRAFDTMLVLHRRDDWEPGASKRVEPTEENLKAVVEEKEQAEREAARLPQILKLDQAQLPVDLRASLAAMLELYRLYVEGFRHCTVACFATRRAMHSRNPADLEAAGAAADRLTIYRDRAARLLQDTGYPHSVHRMFDLDCLDRLITDVCKKTASIRVVSAPAVDRG